MKIFLSLQPWMEHDNKGLVAKIATGGFLHPPKASALIYYK